MLQPRFQIGQEVHITQNHCAHCRELEYELKHPVTVIAVIPYGDEATYRVEDTNWLHYEVKECCLCTNPAGHCSTPCAYCGQQMIA